jgi:glycosyltransferase involved in cell wall biosynthesis
MRIGLIAAPWIPVPPPNYGGTELVVDHIARGLAARGHDIRLFTLPESTCPVDKAWVLPKAAEPMGFTVPEAQHVLAAYKAFDDVDVIHDHTVLGPAIAAGHKHPDIPVVFTNHNLVTAHTRPLLHAAAAAGSLVAISHDQYSLDPDIDVSAVIHHGIDLDR